MHNQGTSITSATKQTQTLSMLSSFARERPDLAMLSLLTLTGLVGGMTWYAYRSDFFGLGRNIKINREGLQIEEKHTAEIETDDITAGEEGVNVQTMNIILIGEDHKKDNARNMVEEILKIASQYITTLHVMIEFEPSDYSNFKKDVTSNKNIPENFNSLAKIVKESKTTKITPIDISLELLLQGIQHKLNNVSAHTTDLFVNKCLNKYWDNPNHPGCNIKDAINFIPKKANFNNDRLTLGGLLKGSEDLTEITQQMRGDLREEFYKKTSMQRLREEYFFIKIQHEINNNNPKFMVILVGANHYASLEKKLKEKYEIDLYFINQPNENQATAFIKKIGNNLGGQYLENSAPAKVTPLSRPAVDFF